MADVKVDITSGSRGRRGRDAQGNIRWLSIDRIALVSGVAGTGYRRLGNAIDALIASDSTLNIGGLHPDIGHLRVSTHTPSATAADVITVTVSYTYAPDEDETTQLDTTIGTSLRQIQVNTDRAGNLIKATYNGEDYVATVPDDEPITSLRFRRTEFGSPGLFRVLSRQYVGKCNSGPWQDIDELAEAREYKCSLMQASSNPSIEGLSTYTVDYAFEFRDKGDGKWDRIAYYVDPKTGKPPEDVDDFDSTADSGNGWVRAITKNEVDFNELGLTTEDQTS